MLKLTSPDVLPGDPAKMPIVLAHGFFGTGNTRIGPIGHRYFYGVEKTLNAAGHPVLVASVPFAGPVSVRAAKLVRQIRDWDVDKKPIVVAHSMGGLDTRHALTHLGLAGDIAALATVATPHRGSPFADWVLRKFGRTTRGIGNFLRRITGIDLRGSDDLTVEAAEAFNEATPDVAGFPYFSVAAVREREYTFPGLRFSHNIITAAEGDNDGLVGRASAMWGTFLGEWACDHTHSRNQVFREKHPEPTGDVGPLYQQLVDDVETALLSNAAAEESTPH
ncbi:MAG: hypothetical protein AAGD32_15630 [Planctomycetota bacterium]